MRLLQTSRGRFRAFHHCHCETRVMRIPHVSLGTSGTPISWLEHGGGTVVHVTPLKHRLNGERCSVWCADDAPDDGLVRAAVNGTDLGFPTCESHGAGPDFLRTPGAGEQVPPPLTPARSH